MRKFPHPSIFAALIRSSGISRIACRMINTPNAVGSGRINALNVFSHPRFFTIKNNGTIITSDGTIIVKIKNKNNLSFPLKFNFANAYPASEHTITVKITPTTATYTLLKMYLSKPFSAKIFLYCTSDIFSNEKSKSYALIVDLNDIKNMYTNGTTLDTMIASITTYIIIVFIPFFSISVPSYISDASRLIIPRCNIAIIKITRNRTLEIAIAYPADPAPKQSV